ncbi:MAG: hypothetical protein ABGY11_11195 [Candidatus Thioglobus sp.]|jgi:predicted PurR-regulated permease PerM
MNAELAKNSLEKTKQIAPQVQYIIDYYSNTNDLLIEDDITWMLSNLQYLNNRIGEEMDSLITKEIKLHKVLNKGKRK